MKIRLTDGEGRRHEIRQLPGDLKAGIRQGDLSRITVITNGSKNLGLHTGNNSPTVGRGNAPFGK